MFEVVHDGRLKFPISKMGSRIGECDLKLFKRMDNLYIAIVTCLPAGRKSVPVSSAFNDAAAFVVRTFELPDPSAVVWIEHYGARAIGADETWSRLRMTWDPKWREFSNTTCLPLAEAEVEDLKRTPGLV